MMSLRGLLRFQPQIRFSVTQTLQSSPSPLTLSLPQRLLSTSPIRQMDNPKEEKIRRTVTKNLSRDQELQDIVNLDSLNTISDEGETVNEETGTGTFSVFPDENTADQLFNGIPFKDLPVVLLLLHKNNTRLFARYADGRPIWNNTPSYHGFLNAKKRTNVAGQVAGLNMGQKLRGYGIRTIRVRLDGFNAARVSTLKGIIQAGIEIVAISDVTTVNWDYPQRPRKRPRKN